jgi:TonB family protein
MKLCHCLLATACAAAASLALPVEGRAATCPPSHDREIVPLTPSGDGRFSARVTLGEGPASRTLDMIIDTGAAISGVPAGVANALIDAKQAVELPKRLVTLANGARENERTIGIITVTVGHYVAHQAVAAVTNGTPLLGLPVLRQIGRITIDAAYEQLILNESTRCKTPPESALKEALEPQGQVTEIMKAPIDSSKVPAPAPAEEQKAENARPAHDLTPAPERELPADVTPHPQNDTAEAAAPTAPAPPAKAPVGERLATIEDFPQYKFARAAEDSPVVGGNAESRYLTVVFRLIKSHLHESPELHLESANKQGVINFYVDKGGTLVGRKMVSSSGSPNLDSAVMTAIAAAAPYPAPPTWRARSLHYNFGRAVSAGLPVNPLR